MHLKEKGCEGLDWISLAEDKEKWRAVVDTVMNRRGSQNTGHFLTNGGTVSLSTRTVLYVKINVK